MRIKYTLTSQFSSLAQQQSKGEAHIVSRKVMTHRFNLFHYLRATFLDFAAGVADTMSSTTPSSDETRRGVTLSAAVQYALHNPVKFVALASLVVTGAVPLGVFLLYAAGTVVCTVVAAIVLDLALLTFGVFGLVLALCFALCISGCVAGLFSVVYLGYKAAVGSVNQARTRLTPSTLAPSSLASEDAAEETFDKTKSKLTPVEVVAQDLLTALAVFLDYISSLTGHVTYIDTATNNTINSSGTAEEDNTTTGGEEWFSDLWKSSVTVFALAAAILFMSYTVLVTAYTVIHFT